MKLYLYGIIDSSLAIHNAICGAKGPSVHNVPYRDIGVVVRDIGRSVREATEIDVLEHEAVVERLMAHFTVLPMRFRTVVDHRDNVISIMRSDYEGFKNNLEGVRNKLEFGIKVIWHADRIREDMVKALGDGTQEIAGSSPSTGKRFMQKKFEENRIDRAFSTKADHLVRAVDVVIGKFAAEKRLSKLKTAKLLLDAVYLVERSRKGSFVEAFGHVKDAYPDLKFLLSGPWPAYNFVVSPERSGRHGTFEQAGFLSAVAGREILAGMDSL